MDEWLSQREAASLLAHLARPQAQYALASGLAGAATSAGRRLLYSRDAVEDLASRPALDLAALRRAGAPGVVSLRVPRSTEPSSLAHPVDLLTWARGPWRPTLPLRVLLGMLAADVLPLVVTISSFVVASYDMTGLDPTPDGVHLALDRAGAWSTVTDHRIWDQGRGGRTFRYFDLGHHPRWWA